MGSVGRHLASPEGRSSLAWEPAVGVPPLNDNACLVWWAEPGWLRPRCLALLDAVERDRWRRYRRTADRDRFATGVVVSRIVLGALLRTPPGRVPLDRSCLACGAPHGRPRLAGCGRELRLSVSHAGDRVALAVTRAPAVGVDVEVVSNGSDVDGLEARVLTPTEACALSGLDPARRAVGFLTYWTRKEAVVKATGDGLGADLRRIEVSPPAAAPELLEWRDRRDLLARVTLRGLHPGPGYTACLAVIDRPFVAVRELSAAAMLAP